MGLHAEVPLVAFLGLVRLWITRLGAVLGGAGRSDQRGVHDSARAQQQLLAHQQVRDCLQDLLGPLVRLQQMARAQDGCSHPVWRYPTINRRSTETTACRAAFLPRPDR